MKVLKTIFLIVLLSACTKEEDLYKYTVFVSNESGSELEIKGFNSKNELVFQEQLNNLERTEECSYLSTHFSGMIGCKADSISFVFSNDKGYLTHYRIGSNTSFYFLEEKTPFGGGEGDFFNDLGDRRYEFVITEEDFNNAHELPE